MPETGKLPASVALVGKLTNYCHHYISSQAFPFTAAKSQTMPAPETRPPATSGGHYCSVYTQYPSLPPDSPSTSCWKVRSDVWESASTDRMVLRTPAMQHLCLL